MATRTQRQQRTVTLKDVADRCGLSIYPVSRALNGLPGMSAATAARVRAMAARMGYDPQCHHAARRLALRRHGRTSPNHVVGLLLPSHLGRVGFFFQLFRGVVEYLSARHYGVLVTYTYDVERHTGLAFELPPAYSRGEVDGVIMHGGLSPGRLARLRQTAFADRPVVTMVNPQPGCAAALRDEAGGSYLAARHLLALGHRQVLYMHYGARAYPMTAREAGYRRACRESGVEFRRCFHAVPVAGAQEGDPLGRALEAALRRYPAATALLALHDPAAISALRYLQQTGRRVPEDLSIVGFDDTEACPGPGGENLLASVHVDLVELGRHAAELLLQRIAGEAPASRAWVAPATLAVRGTIGPPRIAIRGGAGE